jgi:hypothetical protein
MAIASVGGCTSPPSAPRARGGPRTNSNKKLEQRTAQSDNGWGTGVARVRSVSGSQNSYIAKRPVVKCYSLRHHAFPHNSWNSFCSRSAARASNPPSMFLRVHLVPHGTPSTAPSTLHATARDRNRRTIPPAYTHFIASPRDQITKLSTCDACSVKCCRL